LLPAGDTNYDRRNVFYINERVEILRASKIGKMNNKNDVLPDQGIG